MSIAIGLQQPHAIRGFSTYINPGGWPVPQLGAELSRSQKLVQGAAVTVVRYRGEGKLFLPRYSVDETGELVVSSIAFYADEVEVMEVSGCAVEFDAILKGVEIGIVSHARWQDTSGDGLFTKLDWGVPKDGPPTWISHPPENFSCKSKTGQAR